MSFEQGEDHDGYSHYDGQYDDDSDDDVLEDDGRNSSHGYSQRDDASSDESPGRKFFNPIELVSSPSEDGSAVELGQSIMANPYIPRTKKHHPGKYCWLVMLYHLHVDPLSNYPHYYWINPFSSRTAEAHSQCICLPSRSRVLFILA